MVVLPADPLATSHARAVLPAFYSREDTVANLQAASLLGLAFATGRGELLRAAMKDCIHQPFRADMCPLLPRLLPLAGSGGVLGVALSGAGPSVLLILSGEDVVGESKSMVRGALIDESSCEVAVLSFENRGAGN
jgi:homoserine kinase